MNGDRHQLTPYLLRWRVGLTLLAAAVLLSFWPILSNGFVWDDTDNLVGNAHYRGLSADNLRWCLTAFHGGHYQPLTWLSFMLDHAIWGERPLGYHLTNLLLHALNAVLFAFLARELIRAADREARGVSSRTTRGALLAAAVFALHPMRVESVAWATERRDVLSAAFFLLALLAYLKAVPQNRAAPLHKGWLAGSLSLFFLSLSAKALGLALPVVLLVLDVYPLRRFRFPRSLVEKLPFFAAGALFAWLALRAQQAHGALIDTGSHGWLSRLAQACYGLVYYVRATFALSWYPLHERPAALDPGEPRFLLAFVLVAAGTVAVITARRRVPALLAAAACYVALVAPVLGLAQSGVQLVADRYSYLACLPWALLAGAGIARLMDSLVSTRAKAALGTAVLAVLALWAVLSWRHTRIWHDEDRLWSTVLAHGPSAMASNNLGVSHLERGNPAEALASFVRALEIVPGYGRAQRNLVDTIEAHASQIPPDGLAAAMPALRRMAETPASAARASLLLGTIAFQRGEREEARRHLEDSVARDDGQGAAWQYLAVTRMQLGDVPGALAAYQRAAALDPGDGRSRLGQGLLLARAGRCAEALEPLREASRLLPAPSAAFTLLGSCLLQLQDREGAVTALRQALAAAPDNAEAERLLRVALDARDR